MISAIQTPGVQAFRPRAASGQAAPTEEQPPQNPADKVAAFGKIDTPQEASQLPILEPTFQFALVMGLAATMDPKAQMAVYLSANTVSDQVTFDQGTGLHKPDENGYVGHGGGYVGMNYFEGNSLKLNADGNMVFDQRFGETDTALTFAKGENGTRITGNIGEVAADLTMNIVMNNTGLHVSTSGTLGGQPYELKTDAGKETWTSQGSLNGVEINKTYTSRQEKTEDGARVIWQGQGTNAGLPQSINMEMVVRKAQG